MSLAAGRMFAGYTVVRLLGSGGAGEVYLAKHPQLPRQDALRVLPAALSADEESRARFDRDADVAETLWHPNIVGVLGHGEYQGRLWMATEFVDAPDAARLVREHHPNGLPAGEVVEIVTAVADALDYARGRHLQHHHVTPTNILVAPVPRRRILLTDFGIPPHSGEPDDQTAVNPVIGAYPMRDRDDQYALAATAHHLLIGVSRFAYPVSHTRPDLAAFDPALSRALATDPSARFATCLDFARALGDGLAGIASTVVSPVATLGPAQFDGPATGPRQPVFVPAWSEEPPPNPYLDPPEDPYPDPDPANSPTATAMPVAAVPPELHVDPPSGPRGRTWVAFAAAAIAITIALVVALAGGERDAEPTARPQPTSTTQPPAPSEAPTETPAAVEPSPLPNDGTERQRVEPPPVAGPDGVGESCVDGYQITGRDDWASHAVRGNAAATCTFVGNVLKSYWDAADPSDTPRTIVAAGAIPCAAGATCSGEQFVVTCAVEGSDPWVTCRGGRDAAVYLY